MGFIIVLMLTTFAIAGSAAGFSVYGLAQVFAGAFIPVVVMGTSLEAGKLVAASYVYRYWKEISFTMKTYLLSAIFVLMVITSAGIFGFLSAAYQTDTLDLRKVDSQIELLEQEKTELYERKRQIDEDVGRIGANYITKRMELIDKYSTETTRINSRIPEITGKIHDLKATKIQEESHVGPIIYIAKVFNQETDDATKWMILLIIFAFDPLAVALTIATNNAMMKHKEEKTKRSSIKIDGTKPLRDFDEQTDIIHDDLPDTEPSPTIEDPIIAAEDNTVDIDIDVDVEVEPDPIKKHSKGHIVITPDMTEQQAKVAHSRNTLAALQKKANRGELTKEEHTLMRLLTHMVRNDMQIPSIAGSVKGGDDDMYITGEKR